MGEAGTRASVVKSSELNWWFRIYCVINKNCAPIKEIIIKFKVTMKWRIDTKYLNFIIATP